MTASLPERACARCTVGFPVLLGLLSLLPAARAAPTDIAALPDPVTVTATRTPTPADAVLASVTVLDRAQIEARQAASIQELLAGEAGIQVSNNGGLGKVSSLFIRGTESEHVLVLVDGVRFGSATLGTTAFEYLPLAEIERIEIVRGPRSSLYGSEAIGGVVQIFTRRGAPAESLSASIGNGSHATQTAHAAVGGAAGAASYSLSGGYLSTDGYRSCRGQVDPPGGCYTDDPASKGYHNASGSARLAYRLGETADVDVSLLRAQGGTAFAGTYSNHEDFVQQAASLGARWSPAAALTLSARAGETRDEAVDALDFVPQSRYATRRASASAQADWRVGGGHLLSLGVDYTHDRIASNTVFDRTSRHDTGVYAEYQGGAGAQQWSLSTRREDDEQFGATWTHTAAWGYALPRQLRLMASTGTGFKAPSFDDLYYPYFGNPALRPEHSRSVEVGLEQRLAHAHWSLHAFATRIRDLIGYDQSFHAANVDVARISGLEAAAGLVLDGWRAELTGIWLDPRNRTAGAANDGNVLPRRARVNGRLELSRAWSRATLTLRLNGAGPRYEDLANTLPLGGYATLDVLGSWALSAEWSLQAKLANATDHRYELALYYPQDRRNYFLTLRYAPLPAHP